MDAIAVNYYGTLWESSQTIWENIRRTYKMETKYDVNHLQIEIYECQLETAEPSVHLSIS